jgi:hypothetical protein
MNVSRVVILLLLAASGCGGTASSAPVALDAAPPTALAPAPSPSLTASATPPPPDVPHGAAPLSERRAHALSIDLMQRTNDAFDGRYPGPPSAVVDDTFVVIAGDPSAPLDDAAKVTRETVDALWQGPFVHRPDTAVVLWVSSSQPKARALMQYRAPGVRSDGLGLYDPRSRQIFVTDGPSGWGTTRHECVHPLLRADFPLAPSWLVEGLPALFEVAEIDGERMRFGAHFRLETVRTALTKPEWADQVKLDTLFTWTTDDAFRKNEALHYGVAREGLRWLHSQGLLWPFYTAWRDGVLDDPTGEKAFQAVVHKNPAEATEAWIAWLRSEEAEGMVPQAGTAVTP